MSRKQCIIREDNSESSQLSYTVIVATITMKLLAVVTPPSIYHGCSIWKNFQKEKFTPVNMRSCERRNVGKHTEIKNVENYTTLDISFDLYFLEKS